MSVECEFLFFVCKATEQVASIEHFGVRCLSHIVSILIAWKGDISIDIIFRGCLNLTLRHFYWFCWKFLKDNENKFDWGSWLCICLRLKGGWSSLCFLFSFKDTTQLLLFVRIICGTRMDLTIQGWSLAILLRQTWNRS